MNGIRSILIAAAAAAVFTGAACQQQANTTNTNVAANGQSSAANHDMANMGHDMANMGHEGHDMSNMGPMASAPGAAEQPYDLQFIDTMIIHHQGAVSMSQQALAKTDRPELKAFLEKIISDQNAEIAKMKEWREKWYAGKPAAHNMDMPGMKMSSEKMHDPSHTKEMNNMAGKDFELHFLDMMTPHHEGAVEMAKDALKKAEHPEIKQLANDIIREQEAEIKKMAEWKADWSKDSKSE